MSNAKTIKTATGKKGLRFERTFSTEGIHPYDEVKWDKRDVVQTNWKTEETVFEQLDVEFPTSWSVNASTIVTSKYFRGTMNSPQRETSLKQVIDRVVNTYVASGKENNYFATAKDAKVFSEEMTWLLLHQHFAFNSPVWFNVGTKSPQQVSACFILSVEDSMDSILNWYSEEGRVFKGGSGAGVNLSKIRGSGENLSNGGTASGPVSFMRGADASAGAIKSGGTTRRAAKMVVLDIDHPDVEQFIETKAKEERKIFALREAGFNMDLDGDDIASVQFQNANNSVRVDDEFMRAVEDGGTYGLRARTTGEVVEEVNARTLFEKFSQAAWECADPGIQYKDTINKWHTSKNTGPINASNPCSEYMSLDDSSCNLASINLLHFLNEDDTFNVDKFTAAVEIIITAMDISICFADFPTEAVGDTTRKFRQLGIGYANLGALLMALGLAYDSDGGRALAASITALMTGTAYKQSAVMAGVVGPYAGYDENENPHIEVMEMHTEAVGNIVPLSENDVRVRDAAAKAWSAVLEIGEENGYRNAQASVLAPTGTIGFMMDCDTTGIEPDFSLVKFKKLVGGGSMTIVNQTIPRALKNLGYTEAQSEEISKHILEKGNGSVDGAPYLSESHYSVFDTAIGNRSISAMGHVHMMAAVQPFLSGAISKTVNLPKDATIEEIEEVYMEGWKLGLKALAVYRDHCKVGQPLGDKDSGKETSSTSEVKVIEKTKIEYRPTRNKLDRTRAGRTTSFEVGGASGYLTTGDYSDGQPGEVFIKLGKQGSTLSGVMDAFSIAISIGLQYGVPLVTYVKKYANQKFEPSGMTDDPDIRIAQSILDYVFRKLAIDYMTLEEREEIGVYTSTERTRQIETGSYYPDDEEEVEAQIELVQPVQTPSPARETFKQAGTGVHSNAEALESKLGIDIDAPLCMTCGTKMQRAGSCYICDGCGNTTGCS